MLDDSQTILIAAEALYKHSVETKTDPWFKYPAWADATEGIRQRFIERATIVVRAYQAAPRYRG